MRSHGVVAGLVVSGAALINATTVHITSYAGTLTTVQLDTAEDDFAITRAAFQTPIATAECGANPGWLTLAGDVLYCLDEGFGKPNGSLTSFSVGSAGQLTLLSNVSTVAGPVSAVVYGEGGKGLAIAGYQGFGINAFNISDPSSITLIQNPTFFSLTGPVGNPARQDTAHPHQAILDPTGNFLIVPDLGADEIRIFALNPTTLAYRAVPGIKTALGSGPRHAAFVSGASNRTFLYVLNELSNTIVGYDVTYNRNSTLGFTQLFSTSSHGDDTTRPNGTTAAEILLSPDTNFIVVSSRFERQLTVPNYDASNATEIPSDPLITFAIDKTTGILSHLQTRAAGGINPRQFSFNRDGTLIGLGLQDDGRAVVIQRDPSSGLLGDIVANVPIEGQVNCFVFDEGDEETELLTS